MAAVAPGSLESLQSPPRRCHSRERLPLARPPMSSHPQLPRWLLPARPMLQSPSAPPLLQALAQQLGWTCWQAQRIERSRAPKHCCQRCSQTQALWAGRRAWQGKQPGIRHACRQKQQVKGGERILCSVTGTAMPLPTPGCPTRPACTAWQPALNACPWILACPASPHTLAPVQYKGSP